MIVLLALHVLVLFMYLSYRYGRKYERKHIELMLIDKSDEQVLDIITNYIDSTK